MTETQIATIDQDHDASANLDTFRWLVLSRAIEDRLRSMYLQSKLRGRLISGRGQEAIPVGAALALGPGDVVAPVHRDLGAHLVRGTTPLTIFRHYLGRADGPSRGRDGDIHMGEWKHRVFPMVSHLPDAWPVLCGVGLAFQLDHTANVGLGFCGDGATSTGAWHEAVNFAAVFDLPLVFVIENNQYAYSTPTARQYRVPRLADRAAAYGIPGTTVDGNDVREVRRAATEAVLRARQGGGPSIVEAMTMRMDGHAIHDDASYVPKKLLEDWAKADPIVRCEQHLLESGISSDEVASVRSDVASEVGEALRVAESEPLPDSAELGVGVYATCE